MTNPVDAAIAAANARAQENAQATAVAERPAATASGVSAYQPQARRSAIEAAKADTTGGVAGYISLKPSGFVVGDKNGVKSLILRANANNWGTTAEAGSFSVTGADNNPRYFRTYDGITEKNTGRPWAQVVSEMQQQYGADKVRPSLSYDLVFELTADVGGLKAKSTIGYSSSYTANRKIVAFIQRLIEANAADQVVEFELIHVVETNRKGNEWGSFEFGDFVIVA